MYQALIKKGRVLPTEVPAPVVSPGGVLIKVVNSCISAGTEVSGVEGSGKSLIRRALEQPEKIKKALNMISSLGIAETYTRIMGQNEIPVPTGYSIAGIVLAVGNGVNHIKPGDRVAAAGAGIANHAEYVDVPQNLVVTIPDNLDFESASTVTLGSIAMQGVRRAQVQMGDYVVIFGTGILGQLALQLASASGARVIAVDVDMKRLTVAAQLGAEVTFHPVGADVVKEVMHYTGGYGADIVIFCAATNDSQSLSDAFAMCRRKGKVIMVGVWGKELRREDIYEKEIDFLISTSYGPGRYDEKYEKRGLDYPYAYVRWTENRNMQEYLRLLAKGLINVKPLIQAVFQLKEVEDAFRSLQKPERPLMVLLDYGNNLPGDFKRLSSIEHRLENRRILNPISSKVIRVGLIGAGNFAVGMHLPNLRLLKNKYCIQAICNRNGHRAKAIADQYDANYSTTDYHDILSDSDIDLVMICTRHNLHGPLVLESLRAGKHTFVEKPLCTTSEDLDSIMNFYGVSPVRKEVNYYNASPLLMVGFNRRFSKYAHEIKQHVKNRVNPLFIHYRMNAGYLPMNHWVHSEEGGGRIIGEACHIIDLFSYLIGSSVKAYASASVNPNTDSINVTDNKSVIIEYEDGSVATLEYFAVGNGHFPKEWLEVHFDEKTIIMDDYKQVKGYGLSVKNLTSTESDKGQFNELEVLASAVSGGESFWPIPLESIIETTAITLDLS